MVTCAVCAREVSVVDNEVSDYLVPDIPHRERLVPQTAHTAHTLFHGCLLEPTGLVTQTGQPPTAHICRECFSSLENSRSSGPPKYALANNLWIGPVPWELQTLTVPEQLLVAQLYPRAFVFKLYNQKAGYRPREDELQSGLRGTVSTYELDLVGASDMLTGNLLPRPLRVLSNVVSVTYIGRGKLPKAWLRRMFTVRRLVVLAAIQWLCAHNPKYYAHITIDPAQLAALPEDDVPDEIMSVVRQEENVDVLDEETQGYDPTQYADEHVHSSAGEHFALYVLSTATEIKSAATTVEEDEDMHVPPTTSDDADVVPLTVSGAVDCDLSKVTASELMQWGLANLAHTGGEPAYAVRHSRMPVSDFPPRRSDSGEEHENVPNFFERAFPCLYPYGCGGIEAPRRVALSMPEQVRWSLQYHDRRFRVHESFPFVAFGIIQRRQALTAARIQMNRKDFERHGRLLGQILVKDLKEAQEQEERHEQITNPIIRLLRKHVHAAAGRVTGSDQSRTALRSQIWSTVLMKGPPYIWLTINPSDVHDPLVQVFAGENIDLDGFLKTAGPDVHARARNVAKDPYAAAKFFHFIIKLVLEILFGVEVTDQQVKSHEGVLGYVSAYFGTVESQNRGTLHLHMLLWLKHAPSATEIRQLLHSEAFREKLRAFIHANIRAYVPGLESKESVQEIPNDKDAAYSRPPNPDSANFDMELEAAERKIARVAQIHTCKRGRCLLYDKTGTLFCKRHAPFLLALLDFVKENGEWGPKRMYAYINAYCPSILHCVRCNNDMKFLTNGSDTKNITFYVTTYGTKKQGRDYNQSALLAEGFAYHMQHPNPAYIDSLRDQNRLLLFRLLNTINREQTLAAVMIMSYLMGWGDVYRSHMYTTVYWSSFACLLFKTFPELQGREGAVGAASEDTGAATGEVVEGDDRDPTGEDAPEMVTLEGSRTGAILERSQVTDYICRGDNLQSMSILEFFVGTYEELITRRANQPVAEEGTTNASAPRRGRPRNQRVPYTERHPRVGVAQRVVRSPGHRNLPNIVGRWFPRNDDPDVHEYYCASMLLLLKPWRNIATDLKTIDQTWEQAMDAFLDSLIPAERAHALFMLSGVQYFHDCYQSARDTQQQESGAPNSDDHVGGGVRRRAEDDYEYYAEDELDSLPVPEQSDDGLKALIAPNPFSREEQHARAAIEIGKQHHIFANDASEWSLGTGRRPANATGDDIVHLETWRHQMEADVQRQNTTAIVVTASQESGAATVEVLDTREREDEIDPGGDVSILAAESALEPADVTSLKPDQRRAYDLVCWHLDQTLAGRDPPALRMILYGEGGSGKSKVIQTITEYFKTHGVEYMLVKGAYTGVAASLINGKTLHTLGAMPTQKSKLTAPMSGSAKDRLQPFWERKQYLIIDEYSMLSKTFLAMLSRNIGIAKYGSATYRNESFGGVNILLCGDLHQFPPVACQDTEYLFVPTEGTRSLPPGQVDTKALGRRIYEEFQDVVILQEQMRITDPVWRRLLTALRYGRMEEEHLQVLESLVLDKMAAESPLAVSFQNAPWSEAALVTPRHAVRRQWNKLAARKWCQLSGNQLFICPAEDRIGQRALTLAEKYALAKRMNNSLDKQKKALPWEVELAKGMKILVTDNVETDLDVTNGARGEIVDIILHPDEPQVPNESVIHLQYMPIYLLVQMTRTRTRQLEGLDDKVIPVEPAQCTMRITLAHPTIRGKHVTRSVRRRQFPVTSAYAFTDYRSQGQTIPYVVVDIAAPPTGGLTLFNLYVALSRSSGRETIRLLRGFDPKMFMKGHDAALLLEDERLDRLNAATKARWLQMTTPT
ncbi:hypothetical protein NM688_g6564 [Phlebia brevispora]|uniref:Uncharacterized protein n=1 Tax=Phlebia brevispora TaxID=194682 RepID=A0ACC1SEM4_9APHY|nr:hypothetical protein NM688_g6564 [Phlebia brevispora]